MIVLELVLVLIIILLLVPERERTLTQEEINTMHRDRILEKAEIASRKARYEDKSFLTRIHEIMNRCFTEFKAIDNLILMDENGVEHQIPLLCATPKGVLLIQTVDYPGKGLFGTMEDEYWKIAQSAEQAQCVSNAANLAMQKAMLVKRLTGIDTKPIAVISKYTPEIHTINNDFFGQRIVLEENLEKEIKNMARYGKQYYPPEFLTQVKDKLLSINLAEVEEEIDAETDVDAFYENLEFYD